MFANIVELRKIGEEKLEELNIEIEQVSMGNFRNKRQRIYFLGKLYKQRGRMTAFLEVLGEFRNGKA